MRSRAVAAIGVLASISILVALAPPLAGTYLNPTAWLWAGFILAGIAIGLAVPHPVVVGVVCIQVVLTLEQELRVLLVPMPVFPPELETGNIYLTGIVGPLPAIVAAVVKTGWPESGRLQIIVLVLALALFVLAGLIAIPSPDSSPTTLPVFFAGYGVAAIIAVTRARRRQSPGTQPAS
jgi:MFS family permease